MKSKLAAGFAVFLMMAIGACGDKTSSSVMQPENPKNGQKSPSGCWLYEKYEAADCVSLTAYSSLKSSAKADYKYADSSDDRYRKPTHLIDLTKVDLEQNVTSNFKLGEFMQEHKGRYAFFAEHVFGFVQKIRDEVNAPLVVTSAFRSPAYNKKIKGATVSRHMYGDALDLAGASLASLQAACRAQGASFIQLYSDGHIHCDWRSHTLDGTFYKTSSAAASAMRLAAMSEVQYKAMQIEISGRPTMAFEGRAAVGHEVNFSATLEEQEEAEPLLAEWSIRAPNGEVFLSSELEVKYKIEQSGVYKIYVRLGGYSDIDYELVVP